MLQRLRRGTAWHAAASRRTAGRWRAASAWRRACRCAAPQRLDRRQQLRLTGAVCALQSSLLALLLASRFFPDPLVRLPCGLSVIVMTLARPAAAVSAGSPAAVCTLRAVVLLAGRLWAGRALAASRRRAATLGSAVTLARLRACGSASCRQLGGRVCSALQASISATQHS